MNLRKIVLAFDSFKGSLSSLEAAECARRGVLKVVPDCEVAMVQMADGGEGTIDALMGEFGGEKISVSVHDPLMRTITASYILLVDRKMALMEMAEASGLTLLKTEERNPWLTSTYGLGEMIKDALQRGCRHFFIGIGGSATNDGGCGMLRALGYRFLDAADEELNGTGGSLSRIVSIDRTGVVPHLSEADFVVACDVKNPLCGEQGAAAVFGPQKGANEDMVKRLDEGLLNFSKVIEREMNVSIVDLPGAGAAGGLGGGMHGVLGADLRPGIEMMLKIVNFPQHLQNADLVLTGEGRIDRQSSMGKVLEGVMRAATEKNIPVVAFGGSVEGREQLIKDGFHAVFSILPRPTSLEEAMQKETATLNLEKTVEQVVRCLSL